MNEGTNPVTGRHIVRYGTAADQKYLLGEFLPTYDQLVINANMVAHMRAALASFVTQRAKNKPYFIDPQTHAFQHDISHLESTSGASRGQIKRSMQALIAEYGDPIASTVIRSHRPLQPTDLANARTRASFCSRVLRFQRDALARVASSSDTGKYYKFLAKKGMGSVPSFMPSFLVSPYFYMSSVAFDDWLDVNVGCAVTSRDETDQLGLPLALQVVVGKEVLNDASLLDRVLERYTSIPAPDAFLVWIDEFSEQAAAEAELRSLVRIFRTLGANAPVVNLYGGYFSVLVSRLRIAEGLAGVVHSLEYGEDRSVVPVGGGVPVAKYYLPALHCRLQFRDAFRAVRALGGTASTEAFLTKVCDCRECKKVITADPEADFARFGDTKTVSYRRRGQVLVREFPLPATKDRSVRHYMWCKQREYRARISELSAERALEETHASLRTVLSRETTGHCATWLRVLRNPDST